MVRETIPSHISPQFRLVADFVAAPSLSSAQLLSLVDSRHREWTITVLFLIGRLYFPHRNRLFLSLRRSRSIHPRLPNILRHF